MTAERVCACGGELAEVASVLRCPSCGAEARTWLVEVDGVMVAAADEGEVYVAPAVLRKLGVSTATLETLDALLQQRSRA